MAHISRNGQAMSILGRPEGKTDRVIKCGIWHDMESIQITRPLSGLLQLKGMATLQCHVITIQTTIVQYSALYHLQEEELQMDLNKRKTQKHKYKSKNCDKKKKNNCRNSVFW